MSSDEREQHETDAVQSELSADELDAQAAVELPDREAMTLIQPEPIFLVEPVSQQPIEQLPVWKDSGGNAAL